MKKFIICIVLVALAIYVGCGIAAMLLLPAKIAEAESALPSIETVLSKIANDQLLVSRRISQITENTLAKGLDKAAEVDAILADPDLNRLALTYLGSDWSIQRSAFLGSVQHMRNLLTMQKRERENYIKQQKKLIEEREHNERWNSKSPINRMQKPTRLYRNMHIADHYDDWWREAEDVRRRERLHAELQYLEALKPNEKDIEAKAKNEVAIFNLAQEYQSNTVGVLNRVMAEQKGALQEQEAIPFRLRQKMSVFNIWPLKLLCDMPLDKEM